MLGNADEWCADWLERNYYQRSPAKDPQGPRGGSVRAIRGGSFGHSSALCHTARRHDGLLGRDVRYRHLGFRVVRLLESPPDATARSADGQEKPWLKPAFLAWQEEVATLPAEEQVKAVSKKLVELNPEFDGKVTGLDWQSPPKIENGVITEFALHSDWVSDISPLRALTALRVLYCPSPSSPVIYVSCFASMPAAKIFPLHLKMPRTAITFVNS
jgi:hypothetical protein